MTSPSKVLASRAVDIVTGDHAFAASEQIQPVSRDSSFRHVASPIPGSLSLTFATLQSVADETLAEKMPNPSWRRIVVFALARFIIVAMGEDRPSRRELNNSQQDALRAKVLIDRLAFGPYVGPRQKAKLEAIAKLLVGVSEDLKERAQAPAHARGPGRDYAAQQFLEDLAEGFKAAIGKWPTLTDRSFSTPFVDLATVATSAARIFASRLDSNLADRLPQPTQVRYLLRSCLDNIRHRPKPLLRRTARSIHLAGPNKHSPA